jgi:7,8-dihydropterin-6-yl-methyl-4-(beta-D-ribofuranosyl)aminobenzene 5'-phosphate synthase
MRISILTENTAKKGFGKEFGFSAFVEFGDKNILFDTGSSGLFIENAEKLGIGLQETDFVVLSHGHWDHADGLPPFLDKFDASDMTFISHPGVFGRKLHGSREYIGSAIGRKEIESEFGECLFSTKPLEFMHGATFLGEVPRTHEPPSITGDLEVDGKIVPDQIKDDSAILFDTDKGGVLLTGCSHSGILNLAKEAEKQSEKLYSVIGGFHLHSADEERLDNIISEFDAMGIDELRPGHCTGEHPTERMEKELGARRITTGEVIEL